MERTKNILSTRNLSIGYKNKELVTDINIVIAKGDLIALMGLNGTGKTSLFKTILGEIKALKGEILIDNTNVNQLKPENFISVVYTDKIDVFGLTVYDLISLGRINQLNWLGKLKKEEKVIIDKYISLLGLESIKNEQVNSLSDGQFQKVMIGRALAQDTPIILLDEPTAFLDVKNKRVINELLKKLTEVENKTIIVSTHDIDFANAYCSKSLLIKNNKIDTYLGSEINEQLFD